MQPNRDDFHSALVENGLRAALKALNETTPHRYTGVFLFDPPDLRNVALSDAWDNNAPVLSEANVEETFCGFLRSLNTSFATSDGRLDQRLAGHTLSKSVFRSYCGALIRDSHGEPTGTICHFDTHPCDIGVQAVEELEGAAVALRVNHHLWRQ